MENKEKHFTLEDLFIYFEQGFYRGRIAGMETSLEIFNEINKEKNYVK